MKAFNFSNYTQQVLSRAVALAAQERCANTTAYHLLRVMLDIFTAQVPSGELSKWRATLDKAIQRQERSSHIDASPEYDDLLKKAFDCADRLRIRERDTMIHPQHLWDALVGGESGLVDMVQLGEEVKRPVVKKQEQEQEASDTPTGEVGADGQKKVPEGSLLNRICVNFTQKAKLGGLEPVVGRDREIRQVIRVLLKRKKNNPLLLGEAGVGKTAIIEGIAQKLVNAKDVPLFRSLQNKEILGLDLMSLIGGTGIRGELEKRLAQLIEELEKNANRYIIFIDEVHNLIGAGKAEGTGDLANYLKPALARGQICVIGATTFAEYKRFIEPDAAFKRRFEPVFVPEPTLAETTEILRALKPLDEEFHNVTYDPAIIDRIPVWATHYFGETRRPDNAINLLDNLGAFAAQESSLMAQPATPEAEPKITEISVNAESVPKPFADDKAKGGKVLRGARALAPDGKLPPPTPVNIETAARFIQQARDIAQECILLGANQRIANLKTALATYFRGQEKALQDLFEAVACLGVAGHPRPKVLPIMFVGSDDTDKLPAAQALAEYLYPALNKIYNIDLAAYVDRESLYTLIGPPRGIEGFQDGGELTEFIKRNPQCCLVLSNIEHCHPNVLRLFIEPLRHGKITDSARISYPLHEAMMIVVTSSLDALRLKNGNEFVGLVPNKVYFEKPAAESQMALIKDDMQLCIDMFGHMGYPLSIAEDIYAWLKKEVEGLGATSRQVTQEAIKLLVEDPLCAQLIEQKWTPGAVKVTLDSDKLKFSRE